MIRDADCILLSGLISRLILNLKTYTGNIVDQCKEKLHDLKKKFQML